MALGLVVLIQRIRCENRDIIVTSSDHQIVLRILFQIRAVLQFLIGSLETSSETAYHLQLAVKIFLNPQPDRETGRVRAQSYGPNARSDQRCSIGICGPEIHSVRS